MLLKIEGSLEEINAFLEHPASNLQHPLCEAMSVSGAKGNSLSNGKAEKKPEGGCNARPDISLEEIREEVPLEDCDSVPEAIEAIMTICKVSGAHLGDLLGLDKTAFSKARNGRVFPVVKRAFARHFPELKLSEPGKTVEAEKRNPKGGCNARKDGSTVNLEEIRAIDISGCETIPEIIDKLQLETNITGKRLAELLEVDKSVVSKARKGITPPFVIRAFKQYLKFPAVHADGADESDLSEK